MLKDYNAPLMKARMPIRKRLKKLGTIKINTVETTPVVWNDKLLRFEWVRTNKWGLEGGVIREVGCYHFVDMETETPLYEFADDHSFGCCIAENGKMYVHGVRGGGGGNVLDTFVSSDLKNWESSVALTFPEDINLYNTSVCKGDGKYVMAIEIGGENPAVGVPFTCVFAESYDLVNWTLLDMMEYSYSRDRYTACPCIRYFDGYYYMIYLETFPGYNCAPYIVRSKDLSEWELAPLNPVMFYDANDRIVEHPENFSEEELEEIRCALDTNNSDVDLCEYQGKTVILYSWGNQLGKEFLGLAEYDGSMREFFESFY